MLQYMLHHIASYQQPVPSMTVHEGYEQKYTTTWWNDINLPVSTLWPTLCTREAWFIVLIPSSRLNAGSPPACSVGACAWDVLGLTCHALTMLHEMHDLHEPYINSICIIVWSVGCTDGHGEQLIIAIHMIRWTPSEVGPAPHSC